MVRHKIASEKGFLSSWRVFESKHRKMSQEMFSGVDRFNAILFSNQKQIFSISI